MKKKIIIISAIVIVIAILAGVYIYVNTLPDPIPPNNDGDVSLEYDMVTVYDKKDSIIYSLKVKNASGEFTLIKDPENPDYFLVEGNEHIKLEFTKTNSLDSMLSSIAAYKQITSADVTTDLSLYGLDAPSGYMEITFEDGSKYAFNVGSTAPNMGYYSCLEGSNNVILLGSSVGSIALSTLDDYRDYYLGAYVSEDNADYITYYRLYGRLRPDDIIVDKHINEETKAYDYLASSPHEITLDSTEFLEKMCVPAITLVAVGTYCDNATAEDLTNYGFDDSSYVLEYTYKDEVYKLTFGNHENGYMAVMEEGDSTIYKIADTSVLFLSTDFVDIISRGIVIHYLNTLDTIKATCNGRTWNYKIIGDDLDTLKVQTDGRDTDITNFKMLYQSMVAVFIQKLDAPVTSGNPILTIEYVLKTGDVDVVRFYDYDSLYCTVSVNGEFKYYVLKKRVQSIMEDFTKYENGVEITVQYY